MTCTGPKRHSPTRANSTCSANQTVRLRITPTTAAVTAASADLQARLGVEPLDVGRAGEDPQEAGRERRPQRHHRAQHAHRPGIAAALPEGGEEADELGDQDQRPGRRLGETQAVEHLAGA